MSRNFAETISVSTSPAAYPLLAIVTATFDSDGAMDRWGLTLQGSDAPHEQSVKNRDTLMHILKSPCRAEISGGDHFGASWSGPTTLRIWDRDYLWILTPRRARGFRNAIHMAIGRFAEQMKPKLEPGLGLGGLHSIDLPPPPATARTAELERENAELRGENHRLLEMVRYLDQYGPKGTAA